VGTASEELRKRLTQAGRALARGDAIMALGLVGRSEDGGSLALRGIAYAQMGELTLGRRELSRAARALRGVSRARVRAALAEVALADGDALRAREAAGAAGDELERLGDHRNAALQRLVVARAHVLLGELVSAERVVASVMAAADDAKLPPELLAVAALAQAEIAVRSVKAEAARAALVRARHALETSPHELLARAVVALEAGLTQPIAKLLHRGAARDADLFGIEDASRGHVMLVDGCRRVVVAGKATLRFSRRPVLFALLLVLARSWPQPTTREALVREGFEARRIDDSHRARLRVEMGRLRTMLSGIAEPVATKGGFELRSVREVVCLLPPEDEAARISLLLGDGASWSARMLAEHAGVSARTVQRALASLVERGLAVRHGTGTKARYARPGTPIASRMLLLGLLPAP